MARWIGTKYKKGSGRRYTPRAVYKHYKSYYGLSAQDRAEKRSVTGKGPAMKWVYLVGAVVVGLGVYLFAKKKKDVQN